MHLFRVLLWCVAFFVCGRAYTPPVTVALFTSKNCHPCSVTDHQFDQLAVDFPALKFRKHELYQDKNIQLFKDHEMKTIPSILLFHREKESKRYNLEQKNVR